MTDQELIQKELAQARKELSDIYVKEELRLLIAAGYDKESVKWAIKKSI